MSRVERALSPSPVVSSLSLSPFPSVLPLLLPVPSSHACHTTSLHTAEGFIEIYSRLRLHVHNEYANVRCTCMRARHRVHCFYTVCEELCVTVRSRVSCLERPALSDLEPAASQVRAYVELYYQSTRRVCSIYNLIRRRARSDAVVENRPKNSREPCCLDRRRIPGSAGFTSCQQRESNSSAKLTCLIPPSAKSNEER